MPDVVTQPRSGPSCTFIIHCKVIDQTTPVQATSQARDLIPSCVIMAASIFPPRCVSHLIPGLGED